MDAQRKASILLVDDNINLGKTLSAILWLKGYAVTTAQDGLEAIERAKERPFSVIFMDIKMPLMDGVETYRRVKQIRPKATVMMMTAYAVEDLVQQALEEGAYGIIYKPLDIEKVVALIEEARAAQKGTVEEAPKSDAHMTMFGTVSCRCREGWSETCAQRVIR